MDWLLLLQSTGGWVFHLRIWSDTAWSQATWGNKSSDFCFKPTPFLLLVFPVLFQVLTSSLAIIHVWFSVPDHCAEMTSYLLLHSQIPWHSALSSTSKVLISFPAELRTGWISDRVLLTPSLTGSRKCKEIPLCCLGFPGCFHWPQWGVQMKHQLSWWKLSLSQGFRNSWGRQSGAAEGMGLCRPSWEDGDTCQLLEIQIPTVKLTYVECSTSLFLFMLGFYTYL